MIFTKTQELILDMCTGEGKTKREISELTGIRLDTINHHLRKLRVSGHLNMVGYDRSKATKGTFITVSSGVDQFMTDNVIRRAHRLPHMAHDPFGLARRKE